MYTVWNHKQKKILNYLENKTALTGRFKFCKLLLPVLIKDIGLIEVLINNKNLNQIIYMLQGLYKNIDEEEKFNFICYYKRDLNLVVSLLF